MTSMALFKLALISCVLSASDSNASPETLRQRLNRSPTPMTEAMEAPMDRNNPAVEKLSIASEGFRKSTIDIIHSAMEAFDVLAVKLHKQMETPFMEALVYVTFYRTISHLADNPIGDAVVWVSEQFKALSVIRFCVNVIKLLPLLMLMRLNQPEVFLKMMRLDQADKDDIAFSCKNYKSHSPERRKIYKTSIFLQAILHKTSSPVLDVVVHASSYWLCLVNDREEDGTNQNQPIEGAHESLAAVIMTLKTYVFFLGYFSWFGTYLSHFWAHVFTSLHILLFAEIFYRKDDSAAPVQFLTIWGILTASASNYLPDILGFDYIVFWATFLVIVVVDITGFYHILENGGFCILQDNTFKSIPDILGKGALCSTSSE